MISAGDVFEHMCMGRWSFWS